MQPLDDQSADLAGQLKAVIETVVDGIITINERGVIRSFNPAAERIFGYRAEEVIGKNISMLMPEPYHSEHDDYLAHYLATGERRVLGIGREVEGLRKDGSRFPLELAVSEMTVASQRMFTGVTRDVSERKQASAERDRFFELSVDLMCVLHPDGKLRMVNPSFSRVLGYPEHEFLSRPLAGFIHPEDLPAGRSWLARISGGERATDLEVRFRRADGSYRILVWNASADPLTGLVYATARDVTDQRAAAEELNDFRDTLDQVMNEASKDALTGVFNRRLFDDDLAHRVERAVAGGPGFSLVMIDVDNFKRINDTFGHTVGDDVLRSIAGSLSRTMRDSDLVCRYGGEEFCVVLPDTSLCDAQPYAERLRARVEQLRGAGPLAGAITISAGVAEWMPGEAPGDILLRADAALYEAKLAGRNRVVASRR